MPQPGATHKIQCNYLSIEEHSGLLWSDAVLLDKQFSPKRTVSPSSSRTQGPWPTNFELLTMMATCSLKTQRTAYAAVPCHTQENHNPQLHHRENPQTHVSISLPKKCYMTTHHLLLRKQREDDAGWMAEWHTVKQWDLGLGGGGGQGASKANHTSLSKQHITEMTARI